MKRILFDIKFVKFLAVGVLNTLFSTVIMFFLYNMFELGYWFSSAAAYIFGSVLSFFLNKNFTFQNKDSLIKTAVRFSANVIVCYVIAYGAAKPIVLSIMSGVDINNKIKENIALLVGMVLFTLLNYFGQRFFAFKDGEKQMNRNVHRFKLKKQEWFILIVFFVFVCIWSVITPFNAAPDERERFLIPQYIYENSSLPTGWELINSEWGFSYGFYPCFFPGIVCALFMKTVSFFTTGSFALVMAARLLSILSGTLVIYFLMLISKLMFKPNYQMIMPVLCACIPQYIYMSSYVNNDIVCVLGIAIIIFAWCRWYVEGWNYVNGLILAAGIVIVALTYYNGYGWILASVVLFLGSYILAIKQGEGIRALKVGVFVAVIVLLFILPFFVRNGLLYDGDVLGMKSITLAGETFGVEHLKPSNRNTPINMGEGLRQMMFGKERLGVGWLELSYTSAIGRFGYMAAGVPEGVIAIWSFVFSVGALGFCYVCVERTKNYRSSIRLERMEKKEVRDILFYGSILLGTSISFLLSVYYSYAVDYQPQGRYLYSMLCGWIFIISLGTQRLFFMVKSDMIKRIEMFIFGTLVVLGALCAFLCTYYPFITAE